jgi:REP element-mobilizing transposase RayT
MPRRIKEILAGRYYHLYNRGVNRGPIFFCPENYTFFLNRLRRYLPGDSVETIAYCLMPTHYHILARPLKDDLTFRMHDLAVSFSKAINRQRGRVGPLFQGRFQARMIERDEDLLHLSRYIHLNPVTAGFVAKPEEWQYSSYADYVGLRRGSLPSSGIVLDQLAPAEASPAEQSAAYRRFVEGPLEDTEVLKPLLFQQ